MGRPPIEDNPLFLEVKAMYEPLKSKVANARVMAEAMVANAKAEVDREMLAVVKYGIENGLSRSAIGRITGRTSNADQIALVERALAEGYVPIVAASGLKPVQPEPEAPAMQAPTGWQFGAVVGEVGPGAEVALWNDAGDVYTMRVSDDDFRRYYREDGSKLSGDEIDDLLGWQVDYYVSWLLYPDTVEAIVL